MTEPPTTPSRRPTSAGEASPEIEPLPILGVLSLVSRASGDVLHQCPMTAERLTIGRDFYCDIRIYAPDVSKTHAVIAYDATLGTATLEVLGQNGVVHTSGGRNTSYKPPAAVILADGDTFAVRKKVFKWAYGGDVDDSVEAYMTPARKTPKPRTPAVKHDFAPKTPLPLRNAATPHTQMRATPRRNTLRLSIVPDGKRFIPTSRRASIGLGLHGATPATAKKPAKGAPAASAEGEYETLLGIMEGEAGEKIYVEQQDESDEEEEGEPEEGENPFVAPAAEAAPAPEAPAEEACAVAGPSSEQNSEADNTPHPVPAHEPPPTSPRAAPVPLPEPLPAPAPATPRAVPQVIPARVAYSTPRGSDSLRKSLLLRSARKVWEAERLKSVDGSIEAGHIEVRRRKSSFGVGGTPRKSLPLPPPELSSSEDEDDDEEEEEDDDEELYEAGPSDKENAPALKWIYEDGQGAHSAPDDSDSDRESLDMDMSIPGQAIINFSPEPEAELSESESDSDEVYEDDDDDDDDDDGEDFVVEQQPSEIVLERPVDEDYDEEGSEEDEVEAEAEAEAEAEDEPPASTEDAPVLVPAARPLDMFYTPQPQRTLAPRRSLFGNGGAPTPGRLGKPVRPAMVQVEIEVSDDEAKEQDVPEEEPATPPRKPAVAATPRKTPRVGLGLTPAQREKLATPRRLPEPPTSFREPVRDPVPFSLHATPHRALRAEPEVPSPTAATPMDDIKRRLSTLRLKTAATPGKDAKGKGKEGRRATVGFVLPETPSRTPARRAPPATAGPSRRYAPVETIEEGDSESLPGTPTATVPVNQEEEVHVPEEEQEEEDEPDVFNVPEPEPEVTPRTRRQRHSIATPTYTGVRELLREPKIPKTPALDGLRTLLKDKPEPKTPYMAGMRELFKEELAAPTPSYAGVREMMAQKPEPKTPKMDGVRALFSAKPVPPTPAMEGVPEMFAEEADEVEVEDVLCADGTNAEDKVETAQKVAGEPKVQTKKAEPAPPAEPEKPTRATRTRLPMRAPTPSDAPAPAPRTRRAVSGPSATTTTTTRRASPVSEPVRRTRRAAPKEAEKEEAASEPVRRSRRKSTTEKEEVPKASKPEEPKESKADKNTRTRQTTTTATTPASAPTRRTTRRAQEVEVVIEPPARRSGRILSDAQDEAPSKPRRAATATATKTVTSTAASRRKAADTKDDGRKRGKENTAEIEDEPAPVAPPTRRRAAAAAATATASSAAKSKTAAEKPKPKPRAAATAPAAPPAATERKTRSRK